MIKLLITTVTVAVLIATALTTTTVYAEDPKDSCREAGFEDGQNGPFSEATYDHCGDDAGGDDAYYEGFIDGCMSVEGNTKDVCESATD